MEQGNSSINGQNLGFGIALSVQRKILTFTYNTIPSKGVTVN